MAHNLIADPGQNAVHFYDAPGTTPLLASIVGNVVLPGADTKANVTAVQIPAAMAVMAPDASIHLADNRAPAGPLTSIGPFALADAPPIQAPLRAPSDVRTRVLRFAGSRPAARDEVDARIVEAVGKGRLRIIDNPREVGGLKDIEPARQKAQVPERPFEPAKEGGPLRITAWLCQRGQELGADRTPECPLGAAQYGALLETRFSQRR